MESRIIELETKLAFQEQALAELSDIVTAQQDQLDRLARELEQTKERLRAIGASNIASEAEETPPPHY